MRTDPRIDTLRGLACLLLVSYHVIGSDPSFGLRVEHGPVRWLNDGLAYLRMPLFTVLSGVVYGLRPFDGNTPGFLAGKARRLLVPMLFVGTLFALVQSVVPSTNAAIPDWRLLHLDPVGHFWFVESLFWIFVLVGALDRFRVIGTPRDLAVVWLVAAAVYLTVRGPRWLGIEGAIYLLPYFLAGLAVSRFALWSRLRGAALRGGLLAAAVLAVLHLGVPEPNPDRRTVAMLVVGLCLCGLCLGLDVERRWLARIGASSYAIFVFHVFFTAGCRIALEQAGVTPLPLQAAAGLLAGVAGPMLIDCWASRRPWLRVLLLGKSPGSAARPLAGRRVEA